MLHWLKTIPKYYFLIVAGGLVGGFFMVSYWPQDITFSYRDKTCIGQPHFRPGRLSTDSSSFKVESVAIDHVGSTPVMAKKVCFTPISVPKIGNYTIAVTLPGVPFIKKQVTIRVPPPPLASAAQMNEPIPVSKKLVFALSSTDTVFFYRLYAEDKSVECESQPYGIGCDIKKLELKQGTKYALRLDRYFNDERVATVLRTEVTTLKAAALISSSIKEGEMVFAKPESMTLQFDKPITEFEAILVQSQGDKKIEIAQSIRDKEVTVRWPGELARQQSYTLKLLHVRASDGSLLPEATTIGFKMSGGPTVQNINIGTYGVAAGATATITFDQPLLEDQDINKIITLSGNASVAGYQGRQMTVSFAKVPRCTDVSIKISDNLESSYGVKGGSSWQFTTRTICQSVISIGTSVKGRSILAYIFGSGAKKIVYTGAIHGDEVGTRSLMYAWIDNLEANVRSIPTDKTVIVVPTLNPDGYAGRARTNAHNVDLNRNFGTSDWLRDITTVTNQPFPNGGGVAPFSEPESEAIANYIEHTNPELVLSYHSIGGLVAANQTGISAQFAKRYASLSGYGNATGSSSAFDYSVSGTADDYYGQNLGIPSILVETGSHTYSQFSTNRQAMWAMLREV